MGGASQSSSIEFVPNHPAGLVSHGPEVGDTLRWPFEDMELFTFGER